MVEAVNKNLLGVFPRASGEADRDTQPPKTTMAHAPIFGSVYQINDNNKNYQRSTEWCAADYRSFFGIRHIMWPSPMTLILGVTAEREGEAWERPLEVAAKSNGVSCRPCGQDTEEVGDSHVEGPGLRRNPESRLCK